MISSELVKRSVTSLILLILIFFCLFSSQVTWLSLLVVFSFICIYEFYNLFKKIYNNNFLIIISLIAIGLYFYFFNYLMFHSRIFLGEDLILILLCSCIFSDIGGYFIGKRIGGPKLTKISPNKTISGAIGSILFTLIGTSLIIFYFGLLESITFRLYLFLFMMSILCQVGDLLISFLKRKANIKDTGNLLPGHGGLLDRVDGIIISMPFGILILFLLVLDK